MAGSELGRGLRRDRAPLERGRRAARAPGPGRLPGEPQRSQPGRGVLRPAPGQGTRDPQFSASTVDQRPKEIAAGLMFGTALSVPVPDVDRTDHLLVLGANPYISNGSLATAPDWPGRLDALVARGGRLIVVDPRRSRTAEAATEHVPIRPGADAHLLMAMVKVLFAEDLV